MTTSIILHKDSGPRLKTIEHLSAYVPERGGNAWSEWWELQSWEMDYVECPGVMVQVEEASGTKHQFDWPERSWVVFAPGIRYRAIFQSPVRSHEEVWIQFATAGRLDAMERKPFAVATDDEGLLLNIGASLARCHSQGSAGYDLTISGQLMTLLGELQRAANRGQSGTSQEPWVITSHQNNQENGLLGKVDSAVMKDIASPPSLTDLAQRLGISVSSLAHRLKAETGWTVVERIRWLRVREAQQLMSKEKLPIKKIGHLLGFSSAAYFTKVFTEVSGLSPREYLRSRKTEL